MGWLPHGSWCSSHSLSPASAPAAAPSSRLFMLADTGLTLHDLDRPYRPTLRCRSWMPHPGQPQQKLGPANQYHLIQECRVWSWKQKIPPTPSYRRCHLQASFHWMSNKCNSPWRRATVSSGWLLKSHHPTNPESSRNLNPKIPKYVLDTQIDSGPHFEVHRASGHFSSHWGTAVPPSPDCAEHYSLLTAPR